MKVNTDRDKRGVVMMRGTAAQSTTRPWPAALTARPGARHAVGGVDAAGPVRGHEVLVVEVVVAAVHQHAGPLRRLAVLVTEGQVAACVIASVALCVPLHNISFSTKLTPNTTFIWHSQDR